MNTETQPKNDTATKVNKTKKVEIREISFSGLMPARDVQLVCSLSRVSIWRMEREKKFPARVQLSPSRIAWHGNEIKGWIAARPRIEPCEIENGEVIPA